MERLQKIGQIEMRNASLGTAQKMGIGFEKLDRGAFQPEKAYDRVADLGIHWVRIQSGWARTETEKGVYHFEWLDDIVDNILRRGMEPWICLCYGNPVYTPFAAKYFGAVGCPPIETEEEREGWRNYVTATVKHFAGRVQWFEVWNEPDGKYSWKHSENGGTSAPSAKEYAEFCIDTAKAVHAANENAKVIGFALAKPKAIDYLNTGLAHGAGDYLDAVSFHVYSSDDTLRPYYIDTLRSVIDHYNPKLELIQGEAGAQSRSDGAGAAAGFAWTPTRQMKYLLRATLHDLAGGVKFSSYFSTMDMIEALHGLTAQKSSYLDYGYFGVLSADFDENGMATGEYTPKPSYRALGTLSAVFYGDWSVARLPIQQAIRPSRRLASNDCSDRTISSYGFTRPNGSAALAYWNAVPILTTTYEGTISFDCTGVDTENIKLIDLATGAVYALPESMIVHGESGFVELVNLPLTDSPLLLNFGDFVNA